MSQWRQYFPVFQTKVYDKPLIYLDSGATTLKPRSVIDKINQYYEKESVNIHRGLYYLSEKVTSEYEQVRIKVRDFICSASEKEVVFTSGTTASLNLVAQSFGQVALQPDDEVLITHMEHHANIVPWQMACERFGCKLRVLPVTDRGELDLANLDQYLSAKTKILAFNYVSNTLGTVNPISTLIAVAKERGIITVVDAAQAVAHFPIDVQALGCDFLAFSAHKMFGPTGCGVLYGRKDLLAKMRPIKGGGDMIRSVSFEKTTYTDVPHIFEAGTPHIAGVLGLGAAIDFLQALDWPAVEAHEKSLLAYAHEQLSSVEGLRIIGQASEKVPVVSFVLKGIHAHDIGAILDREGLAIRTGHHCTQPLVERFGVSATARASMSFYNTKADIDVLVKGLKKVQELLQ